MIKVIPNYESKRITFEVKNQNGYHLGTIKRDRTCRDVCYQFVLWDASVFTLEDEREIKVYIQQLGNAQTWPEVRMLLSGRLLRHFQD
jgi:hypothetical protein